MIGILKIRNQFRIIRKLSKDKSVGKKFESVTVRVINGQTDIFKHFNQMNVSKS